MNSVTKQLYKKLQSKNGFTLVELIVVLVIMGILTAALVPTVTGYVGDAREQVNASNLHMVKQAANLYLTDWEIDGKSVDAIGDEFTVGDLVEAGYLSGMDNSLEDYVITYTAAEGVDGKYSIEVTAPEQESDPESGSGV